MHIVHIGFPKTATTFLQTSVFPRLTAKGFAYLGKEPSEDLFSSLIDDDDTIFDPAGLSEQLREIAAPAGKLLASFEGLTGLAYRSGFVNRSQIARRLRRVGFERVLITIRNQYEALESAYKQYVTSGGVLRFHDYIAFDPVEPRYLDPRYFDYHLTWECYAALFGGENVLVLQYEDLGQPCFLQRLAAFLDTGAIEVEAATPANRSLSYRKTALLRLANHFTYSSFHPSSLFSRRFSTRAVHRVLSRLPLPGGRRSFLDEASRRSIAGLYSTSNRRLAAAAGIQLAAAYP